MKECILEAKNIYKSFGSVQVLEDINLSVYKGEVLALSGENGAGKSTLMKIVAGLYPPTQGEIYYKQQAYSHYSLPYARQMGISLIYQELSIAPNISVMENIFMGSELSIFGIRNKDLMIEKSNKILDLLNTDFDATKLAGELSIAQQQQVEIARALSHNSDLIIMDEPSASLSEKEVIKLFELIASLKKQGITIIYISHKMDEIRKVSDRVSVLRDGKYIGDAEVEDYDKIIYMMVGRTIDSFYHDEMNTADDFTQKKKTVLRLEQVSDEHGAVKDISCTLESGKVIGVSGLVGAGRSELARLIFGADKVKEGKMFLDDKEINISSPKDAMDLGIGMVPEDRKLQGLFMDMSSSENIVANNQVNHAYYNMFLNNKKNNKMTSESIKSFNIKTTPQQKPVMLSGGNQQKVLLSRWINISPKVLIFDEPTRGVDVGAKQEIYKIIKELVRTGSLIIFISSELPEIIHLADRVLVMREGSLVGDITEKEKITQENIMRLCTHKAEEK